MLVPNVFLFTHPPKCAGTSFRQSLRRHFGRNHEPPNCGHWTMEQWITFSPVLPPLTISCVRNPWDRAVSMYYHMCTHRGFKGSFKDYMSSDYIEFATKDSPSRFMMHEGEYLIDFVIRQEHFQEDSKKAFDLLGMKYEDVHERHKTKRPMDDDYRKYYDDETIDIVSCLSRWEIDKFKYKFDGTK